MFLLRQVGYRRVKEGRQWATAVSDKGATMLPVAMTKRWRDSSGWYKMAVVGEARRRQGKEEAATTATRVVAGEASLGASTMGMGGAAVGRSQHRAGEKDATMRLGSSNRDLTSVMVSSGRGRSGTQQRGMRQWPGRCGCSRIGEKAEEAALEATGSSGSWQRGRWWLATVAGRRGRKQHVKGLRTVAVVEAAEATIEEGMAERSDWVASWNKDGSAGSTGKYGRRPIKRRGGIAVAGGSPLGRMMRSTSIFLPYSFFFSMKAIMKIIAARSQGRQMEMVATKEGSDGNSCCRGGREIAAVGGSNKRQRR
ncbi:hypothetical protein BHE74_00050926 [Ensete ventricosum]|nr:hypothetical protein BHE74_00050926 [Ensete ventricosum]